MNSTYFFFGVDDVVWVVGKKMTVDFCCSFSLHDFFVATCVLLLAAQQRECAARRLSIIPE